MPRVPLGFSTVDQLLLCAGKQAHLDRFVTLTRIQEGDPRWNPDPERPLTLLLGFAPRAAFSAALLLLIAGPGGDQWQIDILLESTQPDVDGMVGLPHGHLVSMNVN